MAKIDHNNADAAPRASLEVEKTHCRHLEGDVVVGCDGLAESGVDQEGPDREIGAAEAKLVKKIDWIMLPTLWIMYDPSSSSHARVGVF